MHAKNVAGDRELPGAAKLPVAAGSNGGRDLPDADICREFDREWALSAYSVEKLLGRILLKNVGALEGLNFEQAVGAAILNHIRLSRS